MERRLDAKRETLRAGLSASLDEAQCETDRGIAVKLDILTTRVGNLEYRTQQPPALARPPIADPVKGTSRQKVIQMAHQGRESESIATALRLPRNEVELLLKVHRAVAQVRQR